MPSVLPSARPRPAGLEAELCRLLAEVTGREEVSADAHFFDDLGADSLTMAHFCARVRKRGGLPAVSMRDVYRHPTVAALAAALAESSLSPRERALAGVLAEVLGAGPVPVDAHVFDDLGADSLTMAHFCARVRKRGDLPAFSMKDVYRHPTIRALAALPGRGDPPAASPAATPGAAHAATPAVAPVADVDAAGRPHYVLCGLLQLLIFLGYTYGTTAVALRGFEWVSAASSGLGFYLRAVVIGSATFAGMCVFPIVAKWVLVGRWRPQRIRVWSLAYVRFWVVKTLIRANPLARFFPGSPLYVLYLRALGARIGRGVVIFSPSVPVCTDLLEIGEGTVIRKDCLLNGYRAVAGVIETGPVTIGRYVHVGEMTVIDIGTALGDGATLGHTSSLHEGQSVPPGETWHGSPARRTDVNYRTVEPRSSSGGRRIGYSLVQLLNTAFLVMPLAFGVVDAVLVDVPLLGVELTSGPLTSAQFWLDCLLVSGVLFAAGTVGSLLFVLTVPRILRIGLRADRTYPLYGIRYSLQRTIARTTNSKFLTAIFGDSSYIVGYLRMLGYRLAPVLQTGSNFGTGIKHESPYHVRIGTGTIAADGLSIVNTDFSSSSFRVTRVTIGRHSFLGNAITYPAQARVGDNVLLATKVLVPVDGPVRQDVGLLGSPAFEIPRSVERDVRLGYHPDEVARRLRRKNRYNLRTIGLFLLARWGGFALATSLTLAAAHHYDRFGAAAMATGSVLVLLVSTGYGVLVERTATRFRPLQPQVCSIYDPYFWWHERFWKMHARPDLFNGTPFKGLLWRLLGVRAGRRLFDDGCSMPERSLVTLGDECTLNAGSTIQSHSQEDAGFKSDRIALGAGCTVGVGAWVHYGVTMGAGSVLAPDAFLMKGEDVPAGSVWTGNPAAQADDVARCASSRTHRPVGGDPSPQVAALVGGPVQADVHGRPRAGHRRPAGPER